MKMKTLALALSLFILVAIFSGLTLTSARMPTILYEGTLDTWYENWNSETASWQRSDAKIVESHWRIYKSWDGSITFSMAFTELNVSEDPLYPKEGDPGTYDDIILRMRSKSVEYWPDGIEISGECSLWKNGVFLGSITVTVTVHTTNYEAQMIWTDGLTKIYGSLNP